MSSNEKLALLAPDLTTVTTTERIILVAAGTGIV